MRNAIALVLIFLTLAFTGYVQAGPIGEIAGAVWHRHGGSPPRLRHRPDRRRSGAARAGRCRRYREGRPVAGGDGPGGPGQRVAAPGPPWNGPQRADRREAQVQDAVSRQELAAINARRYSDLGRQKFVTQKPSTPSSRKPTPPRQRAGRRQANREAARAPGTGAWLPAERPLRRSSGQFAIARPAAGVVIAREAEPGSTVVAGQAWCGWWTRPACGCGCGSIRAVRRLARRPAGGDRAALRPGEPLAWQGGAGGAGRRQRDGGKIAQVASTPCPRAWRSANWRK
jgi:biotin carboxyl carrier protein